MVVKDVEKLIVDVPDFPKKGIIFKNITPILFDPEVFNFTILKMLELVEGLEFDYILGIDARGFLFASCLAMKLKKGLALCRKKGKLPGKVISQSYSYEYAQNELEIEADKIIKEKKYLIVDDVLATGNTCIAAAKVIRAGRGIVENVLFFGEIEFLKGRESLSEANLQTISFLKL